MKQPKPCRAALISGLAFSLLAFSPLGYSADADAPLPPACKKALEAWEAADKKGDKAEEDAMKACEAVGKEKDAEKQADAAKACEKALKANEALDKSEAETYKDIEKACVPAPAS